MAKATIHQHRILPAIGYVRVSTEEQAREGVSIDAQSAKIRAYADLQDLELEQIIVDAGESGKHLDRPGMRELLERIRSGTVGTLIIYKLDRLTRSPRDVYLLVDDELNPRDVELVSIQERIDTRTPAGRAMMGIMSVFAQMERELIVERTKLALEHKKAQGERLGTTPLGFHTPAPGEDMVVDLVELEAVELILAMRRRRPRQSSYRAICRELTDRGFRPKRSDRWHPESVRKVWNDRARYGRILLEMEAAKLPAVA